MLYDKKADLVKDGIFEPLSNAYFILCCSLFHQEVQSRHQVVRPVADCASHNYYVSWVQTGSQAFIPGSTTGFNKQTSPAADPSYANGWKQVGDNKGSQCCANPHKYLWLPHVLLWTCTLKEKRKENALCPYFSSGLEHWRWDESIWAMNMHIIVDSVWFFFFF